MPRHWSTQKSWMWSLIPYELEEGMKATMSIIEAIRPGQSVGIFIGPEGGFEEQEIVQAKCRSHSGHTWKKDSENRNCRNYDTFNFDVSSGVCRGSVASQRKEHILYRKRRKGKGKWKLI